MEFWWLFIEFWWGSPPGLVWCSWRENTWRICVEFWSRNNKYQWKSTKIWWIIIERWCIFFEWITIRSNFHTYTNLTNLTYVISRYTFGVIFHPHEHLKRPGHEPLSMRGPNKAWRWAIRQRTSFLFSKNNISKYKHYLVKSIRWLFTETNSRNRNFRSMCKRRIYTLRQCEARVNKSTLSLKSDPVAYNSMEL